MRWSLFLPPLAVLLCAAAFTAQSPFAGPRAGAEREVAGVKLCW